jgi:amino acid adenylation domain-containing protein
LPEPDNDLLCGWLQHTTARTPDVSAVVEDDRITSFSELFEQAASLALRFVEHGIQKHDRVALVLPKSSEAIVAVFASLLAGAICVPIHPRWPKQRIESALAECAARLVIEGHSGPLRIADRQTGASIPWQSPPSAHAVVDSLPMLDPGDPAFILFTSGSTGRPKGVVLSHSAVSAFVRWSALEFQIAPGDRIACPSPLGFDLSTFDIFSMALCGATCVLVPDNIVWMPRFLVQFVREAGITCWYSVPSILTGMLQAGRFAQHEYPGLRLILFAGEVFPGWDLARLQAAVPQAVCANLYGPTETNVVAWCRVPRGFDGTQPLPIGHPCPYAALTMDATSGELLAGGDSLMSGYWNRPEDTQRCLVTLQGKQYYRTGDRVSLAPDGGYLFVGRFDRQVKRRGFRMELGEIEAALLRHEDILEAAAVAVEDGRKGTVITAFVRLRNVGAVTLVDAKAHCGRTLPPYMLPDHILFVDTISKGDRGKIDYMALGRVAERLNRGDQD